MHIDWDLANHGLENVLSSDHLEAILEEANLGSVSQLMAIANTEKQHTTTEEHVNAIEAIDDLLAINSSIIGEESNQNQANNGPTQSEIDNILNGQPQVVINPVKDVSDGFLQSEPLCNNTVD